MFRGGNKVSAGGLGKLNNATKAKNGSRNNLALSSSQHNAADRTLSKAQAEAASTLRNDTRNLLLVFPTLEGERERYLVSKERQGGVPEPVSSSRPKPYRHKSCAYFRALF